MKMRFVKNGIENIGTQDVLHHHFPDIVRADLRINAVFTAFVKKGKSIMVGLVAGCILLVDQAP